MILQLFVNYFSIIFQFSPIFHRSDVRLAFFVNYFSILPGPGPGRAWAGPGLGPGLGPGRARAGSGPGPAPAMHSVSYVLRHIGEPAGDIP